jgi:ribonuclease HII
MSRARPTLAQIRSRYLEGGRSLPAALERWLRQDVRPSARALVHAIERRRRANRAEGQRLRKLLRYEVALWTGGLGRVAGVDEAGMSPLAGPVSAAAVVFPPGTRIPGVDDSKKLTAAERERLAPVIKARAAAWSVVFVEPEEIDRLNIYWAGVAAMMRAIEGLGLAPEHVLVDGRRLKPLTLPQQAIVGGDRKSLTIAAASILAKTARDARMREMDAVFPGYGFAIHKGYPVKAHVTALRRLGPCPIHRRSFAPVRQAEERLRAR